MGFQPWTNQRFASMVFSMLGERKRVLIILLAVIAFLARSWGGMAQPFGLHPKQPNIIFIMADDLGYGEVGCYGQEKIKTPNLDRMAAEGMRFTQCYAGTTVCAPSRASLMTGLHTGHTRIRGNEAVPLQAQDLTVAEVLKEAGYKTGIVGKWGLGLADTPG